MHMSMHVSKRGQVRTRIGEPIADIPIPHHVPPTVDDRLRLRHLEYQVRLLAAAVESLADAAAANGHGELARRARYLAAQCGD
jgi:hypothetical protein